MKKKIALSFLWSFTDRFIAQGGQLITNLVLARILTPDDFGLIGMLSIFIAISQIIIDSGLGTALIQKQDRTDIDFSTVFVFNFAIALLCYILIFFLAPYIAAYFERQELNLLSKVLSIVIIINSLAIIQKSKMFINMDFKTIAKVNSLSILFSSFFSIVVAINGFGVWAIVIFNLLISIFSSLLFWLFGEWRISLKFSNNSFNQLFSYGYKILISNIYSISLGEFYGFAIGKNYSANALGYYSNSKKLSDSSSNTITSIIQQVTFPLLSSLQEDKAEFRKNYISLVQLVALVIFPIMTIFALHADFIIRILLTDKWESSIILLEILCLAKIFTPINALNMNVLNALGRSDLYLKLDLIKLPVIVAVMFISIPNGLYSIVIGILFTSLISFFINTYYSWKFFNYGAFSQLKDMSKIIIATSGMAILTYLTLSEFDFQILYLILSIILSFTYYLTFCYLLNIKEIYLLANLIAKKMNW